METAAIQAFAWLLPRAPGLPRAGSLFSGGEGFEKVRPAPPPAEFDPNIALAEEDAQAGEIGSDVGQSTFDH